MGPSYNSAYRYFADNPDTKEMDQTAFDKYLIGVNVQTLMIQKKMLLIQQLVQQHLVQDKNV